jgi:hypothetical protein
MSLILSGTNGLSDVDGSAATPAIRGTDANTGMFFPAADTIAFAEGGVEAMRLDSNGNVGIGTSSPAFRLDVGNANGTIARFLGTGGQFQGVRIQNNHGSASQAADVFYDVANENGAVVANMLGSIQTDGGSSWSWGTQLPGNRFDRRVERMRIDSSGNLLVGTTSVQNDAQVSVLTKNESTSGMSIYVTRSSSGFTGLVVDRRNSDGQVATWLRGGTAVGNVSVTGSATAYNTSSDYRLKNTVAPMTGALAKVQQLKPVTYKWNSDNSDSQGFIAHELQKVVPECVTGQKDAVDADGKPVYQGIDTSFLVATLTAAIQEQQAMIEQLKADVAALKGTV